MSATETKYAIQIAALVVVWALTLWFGYVSLDNIAAVSPRLETAVIALLAIYALLAPVIVGTGAVLWLRARKAVAPGRYSLAGR
jgi:hypothetical protein